MISTVQMKFNAAVSDIESRVTVQKALVNVDYGA